MSNNTSSTSSSVSSARPSTGQHYDYSGKLCPSCHRKMKSVFVSAGESDKFSFCTACESPRNHEEVDLSEEELVYINARQCDPFGDLHAVISF